MILCRGYCVHLGLQPADLLPTSTRTFDTPPSRSELSSRPESATMRSGAYRDRTFTCWDNASFRTRHAGQHSRIKLSSCRGALFAAADLCNRPAARMLQTTWHRSFGGKRRRSLDDSAKENCESEVCHTISRLLYCLHVEILRSPPIAPARTSAIFPRRLSRTCFLGQH